MRIIWSLFEKPLKIYGKILMEVSSLPALNACLNGIATVFLLLGYMAVKKGRADLHAIFMKIAFGVSAAFLVSYLIYHFQTDLVNTYHRQGVWRWIYYSILITHIPLATLMVPFIVYAVVQGLRGEIEKHVKVTKIVWPVWMYVSITGVIIYLMLYQF